jgi:ceramide glucosyltransferase
MNTEFWGGVFTASLVEGGVHFAVGPTAAARKQAIADAGGWQTLSRYLAEDFVLGQFAARAGWRVILSRAIVEHRIGSQSMRPNFAHRLRWNRSTRRSRPAGYAGLLFTYPLPAALLLAAANAPIAWLILPTLAIRGWAAVEVAQSTLGESIRTPHWWWRLPLQDGLSFVFWLAGFFGREIEWRGRRYLIDRTGMIHPL